MSGPLRQIDLGSARGGQAPELVLDWELVRELVEEDLPAITAGSPVNSPGRVLNELRSQHHEIAQLYAKGTPQQQIHLITGYSQSYLSTLKTDPAFNELVEYYRTQREEIFVDLLKREKDLALYTLEEIQSRLASDPNGWSKKELLDLYEKLGAGAAGTLNRGKGQLGSAQPSAAPGPAIAIHFHTKPQGPPQLATRPGLVIEGKLTDEG